MNYAAGLGDKSRRADIKESLSGFQRETEANKKTQENKRTDCRQPKTNRAIGVKISIAMVMKTLCAYRKNDEKKNKKKYQTFKTCLFIHMDNFTKCFALLNQNQIKQCPDQQCNYNHNECTFKRIFDA